MLDSYVYAYQEWDILKEQKKDNEQKTEKIVHKHTSRPSFGFMLQEARIKKRMTTLDVANHINVSTKMISMFESGTEIPDHEMTRKLSHLLDF
tara:strand:- start:129 stop:407 length:279 start_codon:yes stop_codon:yes gene_type:complete